MTQAKTKETPETKLETPRFEEGRPLLIAGLQQHYKLGPMNLSGQWQRFGPYIGKVPGQVGRVAYGVLSNGIPPSEGIDYLAGVEVSRSSGLPEGFTVINIPALKYAVFPHHGHVSQISKAIEAIFFNWLPQSGHKAAGGISGVPDFFERYGEEFNPQTATGGIELWIPIQG